MITCCNCMNDALHFPYLFNTNGPTVITRLSLSRPSSGRSSPSGAGKNKLLKVLECIDVFLGFVCYCF